MNNAIFCTKLPGIGDAKTAHTRSSSQRQNRYDTAAYTETDPPGTSTDRGRRLIFAILKFSLLFHVLVITVHWRSADNSTKLLHQELRSLQNTNGKSHLALQVSVPNNFIKKWLNISFKNDKLTLLCNTIGTIGVLLWRTGVHAPNRRRSIPTSAPNYVTAGFSWSKKIYA